MDGNLGTQKPEETAWSEQRKGGGSLKVEQMQVVKEKAVEEYDAYKEALKKPHFEYEQYLKDMKAIYGHMKHGRKIIDLWASMTKAGLNEDGDPRLAICRADSKHVQFEKKPHGRGIFNRENKGWYYNYQRWKRDIEIPEGTFPAWPLVDPAKSGEWISNIKNNTRETIVPIIPAKFLNVLRGGLHNYDILWEVKEWKPSPPKDPMLLRKLTPNMFVVLATWNLTPLERAVIRGRIQ